MTPLARIQRTDRVDRDAEALTLARLLELRHELARPVRGVELAPVFDPSAALARLAARRARAVDAFTSGDLSRDDMRAAVARIEDGEREVRGRADRDRTERAAAERARDPERRAAVLEHVAALRRAWARLDIAGRRETLRDLARRVRVGRGGVTVEWRTVEELGGAA